MSFLDELMEEAAKPAEKQEDTGLTMEEAIEILNEAEKNIANGGVDAFNQKLESIGIAPIADYGTQWECVIHAQPQEEEVDGLSFLQSLMGDAQDEPHEAPAAPEFQEPEPDEPEIEEAARFNISGIYPKKVVKLY